MLSMRPDAISDLSAESADGWDRVVFRNLSSLIGEIRAKEIAGRFRSDLGRRFLDVEDREILRRDAHAVTSSAGMLGFANLCNAARQLEATCEGGAPIPDCIAKVERAKEEAVQAIERFDLASAV